MKSFLPRKPSFGFGALTLTTLLGATSAMAQEEAASATGEAMVFEPIVISGEKMDRDLKSTASSVDVKSGREIDQQKTGSATVHEVLNDVPNVLYTDTIGSPIIRGMDSQGPNTGQNQFFGGTVPRATVNLDGHYLNNNEMYFGATSVWDLDDIEVFRGPQTTSQGANAIAGAIIVNTKNPTFQPEAAYQAEMGNYNSRRQSLMVSGPLVGEDLAGRLTVDHSSRDTFIDYTSANFLHDKSDQDFEELNLRGKLLWLPSNLPGLATKLTFAHNASNRPSQEAASGDFDKLKHATTTMPSWDQSTNTTVLDVDYDFDNGLKLFNQSQYSINHVARYAGNPALGDARINQKNASNETRLTFGDQYSVLSGVTGVYVAHTTSEESLLYSGLSTFDDTKDNLGVFGELNYRLDDRWTLTTGLRYQQDHIQRDGLSSLSTNALDYDKTFSAALPKVSLAFAVNPQWTVGAMVSKGYNPGGVALNLTSRRWQTFKDESVWNYELFSRASLLDDRLQLTGNVFYMDMKDYQYNIPVVISTGVTQSYTINAEKAHAYGLELSADYQVLDSLKLKASAGALRTRIDKIDSNDSYQANEFAKSPGYTVSFGPSWDATDKLNLSAQVRHIDGYYSDTANTKAYAVDGYTLTDVRAGYKFSKAVELYGYVKNVFDDRSPTYMQQNRGIGGIEASMTTPRMFGVGVKGAF